MSNEITHKVVKYEGVNHGMNYTPIVSNQVIKTGNEESIRKYFADLYMRSLKHAKEDTIRDCKCVTRSKNSIYINTLKDTVLLFEVKKLTPKEWRKYNEN